MNYETLNYNYTIMKKLIGMFALFLAAMKHGSAMTKLTVVVLFSTSMGIMTLLNKLAMSYIFPDTHFAKWFILLIMLDTTFGVANHWRKKEFDPEKMITGLLKKLAIGVGVMMFGKMLMTLPELVGHIDIIKGISIFLKSMIISWLGLSFFGSVHELSNKKIPPSIFMNKFKKFSETLDPKDLTENKE